MGEPSPNAGQPRTGADRVLVVSGRRDERWKERVVRHLRVWCPHAPLDLWDDRRGATTDAMSSAAVAIVLASADPPGADVAARLARRAKEGGPVFAVVIAPGDRAGAEWFERAQVRPTDGTPLSALRSHQADTALALLAGEVRNLLMLRRRASPERSEDTGETELAPVEITVDRPFSSFAPEDQSRLLGAIAAFLGMGGELRVFSKRPGSVRLILALPPRKAEDLYRAVRRGEFTRFAVVDVALLDPELLEHPNPPYDADDEPTTRVSITPSEIERPRDPHGAAPDVPGYRVEGPIGRGGMGVVYRAVQLNLNRTVALKTVLNAASADRVSVSRFWAEAEVTAAVKHPHVIEVYEFGEHDGVPFIAMEHLTGGSLAELLRCAPPSPRDAAALVAKIARGVAAAHAVGIVHRNLKPNNVMLAADGEPKVIDFGIAKRGDGSELTQTGQVMGTPAYMSPEQARGEGKVAGPASDVWALGVILYEALTGARPFAADSIDEILQRVLAADVVPPRKTAPALARDLELICLKCLAKEPCERYPTARELAGDLDRFLGGLPITVRPAGVPERVAKWAKRNPTAAALCATAALCSVLLVSAVVLGIRLGEARTDAAAVRQAANSEREEMLAANAALGERVRSADVEALTDRSAFARTLLGTLGSDGFVAPAHFNGSPFDVPLSPPERDALRELTSRRRSPLVGAFLVEGTRSPLACRQFAANAPFAVHAAVGLAPDLRDRADRTFAARLGEPGTAEQRLDLARVCARSAVISPETAERAAPLLRDAALAPGARAADAHDLCALVLVLPPDRAAPFVLDAMERATDPLVSSALARTLARVADRLPPVVAAPACDRAADFLSKTVPGAGSRAVLSDRATALAALAPFMSPDRARAECERLARRLVTELEASGRADPRTRFGEPADLGLAALVGRLPSDIAAELCERAGAVLADAVTKANAFDVVPRAAALAGLADRLAPAKARAACEPVARQLADALAKATNANADAAGASAEALAIVSGRLPPSEAAVICERVGRHLGHLVTNPDRPAPPYDVLPIATGLAALATRTTPGTATALCEPVADALGGLIRKTDPDQRGAGGLLREYSETLAVLAPHLTPVKAESMCRAAAAVLGRARERTSSPNEANDIAVGLGALAVYLGSEDGPRFILDALTAGGRASHRSLTADLAATVLGFTPSDHRRWLSGRAIFAAFAAPHHVVPALPLLYPHFHPHPRPLPPQSLVELLKHPFCVGDARRAVLDAFAFTYGRPFGDQWEFVAYAQKHQPQLDLLTPPKYLERP